MMTREILLAGRTLQDTAWAQSAAQEVALSQRSRGTEEIGRPALPMARAGPGCAPPSPWARHIVPGSYAGLPVLGSPPYTSASCAAARAHGILVLALALGSLAGTTSSLDSAYYYPGEGPCCRLESWGAAEIAAFFNAAAGDESYLVTAGAPRRGWKMKSACHRLLCTGAVYTNQSGVRCNGSTALV